MAHDLEKRSWLAGLLLVVVITIGTSGYYLLDYLAHGRPFWELGDCFYMTIITLTTVGFGELNELANVPGARLFTVLILFGGLGIAAYAFSNLTAFLVEGELTNVFWRKKMIKQIRQLSGHLILCGVGRVGCSIMQELLRTNTAFVVVDPDEKRLRGLQEQYGEFPAVVGDATHAADLHAAGVAAAKGVISTLDDDKDNLCVVVTCRQLNPQIHVISSCRDPEFSGKLELIGAEVVMPSVIGGLRMASQMIRPRVVRYLDRMLRDEQCTVRIEDVVLTSRSNLIGQPLSAIDFDDFGPLLVMAIVRRDSAATLYNPRRSEVLAEGDTLVVQTDAESLARFRQMHA
ncbi:MAG TPA: potassium channel protein [Desulfurivibrionaceae bacterium]|nr:potassium channel protein [Desulfurivibrionaceae bacterium]